MKEELQKHINKETRDDIGRLYNHAEIANQEMGVIKVRLAVVEDKVITAVRQNWAIIALIIAAAIAVIFKD